MQTAWEIIMTRGRTFGPMISLMYTTLMARNPANPSVSAIDRTNSAEKFVTYPKGQMNAPASSEDRISALRRRSCRPASPGHSRRAGC